MKAGSLDRRVTIQRKTVTQSPSGEPMETWANVSLRRAASMWPVKGDEQFASPEKVASDQVPLAVGSSRAAYRSYEEYVSHNRALEPAQRPRWVLSRRTLRWAAL